MQYLNALFGYFSQNEETKTNSMILLENLTPEEIHLIETINDLKDLPDQSREIYYRQELFQLCQLIDYCKKKEANHEEENIFEELNYVPYFANFQKYKWQELPLSLLKEKSDAFKAEISRLRQLANTRVKQNISVPPKHPYEILLNKLRNNVMEMFAVNVAPKLEQKIKKMESAFKGQWENDFRFDITNDALLPVYDLNAEKEWLDLAPVYYYFEDNTDSHPLAEYVDNIKSLKNISNQDALILWLEDIQNSLLPIKDPQVQKLKEMLLQYELIDKTDVKKIYLRHRRLIQISKQTQKILAENATLTESQIGTLDKIHQTVFYKSSYIQKMAMIPLQAEKRAFRTAHVKGKPLIIDKKEDLTDLDPLHREGYGYLYQRWLNAVESKERDADSPIPHFWLWMENLPYSEVSKLEKDPRYQVPKQEKLVTIREGLCYNPRCSNRGDGLVEDGVYLYNIDKNNDLYILPTPDNFGVKGKWENLRGKGKKEKVSYNHNSVLNGESVKCAGCICFVQGKIVHIDTNSGHYLPRMDHLQDAVKTALIDKQVFTEDAIVTDYEGTDFENIHDFVKNERNSKRFSPEKG